MKDRIKKIMLLSLFMSAAMTAFGASYHLDSHSGSDQNDGLSPKKAWATLKKANLVTFKKGDQILLKRGSVFLGKLALKSVAASKAEPLLIDAYGVDKKLPRIDAPGYIAGITIEECSYVDVKNLEITSDGGKVIDVQAEKERYGVYISQSRNVSVDNLNVHSIFATTQTKSEGKNGTTAYGHGIRFDDSQSVRVSNCIIKRVGRYGINGKRSKNIEILTNKTDHTGCSGLQLGHCNDVLVQDNLFDHPGSSIDKRMHARGSGSWVFGCNNVLYERNWFLNAKGKADSCGIHIDFNCKNVVVQYCFSMNNEGGFVEILGNNHNCAYRYNISVNDGFRKKGKGGAHQEGKVLWLSGYCGRKKKRSGPFNSYIYNNTIYVKKGEQPSFSISPTTRGALVANNIFHILGETRNVIGDQKIYKKTNSKARDIVFENNVYIHNSILPTGLGVKDKRPILGDSGFINSGGKVPRDYTPTNAKLLKDKSMKITKILGDKIGITIGFDMRKDFFGSPIKGIPDIGAIELKE